MLRAKLALGPMSSEVIEATFKYAQRYDVQLMLIASKSQIDYCSGYVNNWNTYQYAEYIAKMRIMYPWADVLVCRDHCGPGFSKNAADLDDAYSTLDADLRCKFDLIHVDLCFLPVSHEERLLRSVDMINYAKGLQPNVMIEVGTDENTGNAVIHTHHLEKDVDFFLKYCKPDFYVAQTGSLVKEINQTGIFDVEAVKKISEMLHSKGLKLKEHNADYLPDSEIELRRDVVDAVNIAPMLGVIQTQFVLAECMKRGIDTTEFLEKSYKSHKWHKWLCKHDKHNKYLCALIAGHYNFATREFEHLMERLSKAWIGVHTAIIDLMMSIIDRYQVSLDGFRHEVRDYV